MPLNFVEKKLTVPKSKSLPESKSVPHREKKESIFRESNYMSVSGK